MEGGSANDYDYAAGDRVNNLDLDGNAVCKKHLAGASGSGVRAHTCIINRKPSDRSRGRVRLQFEINVRTIAGRLNFVSGAVVICGSHGNCATRIVSPLEAATGKHKIHTSIALAPGEAYSVYGYATFLGGEVVSFIGGGLAPDESVYGRGG